MNDQLDYDKPLSCIGEIDPTGAYNKLVSCSKSFLIDVRSQAEWNFVGFPNSVKMQNDVVFCEWASYPKMTKNPTFLEELLSKIYFRNVKNLYFLCRSGARSFQAASEVKSLILHSYQEFSEISLFNVTHGFEGDLSEDSKRGKLNGWKCSNLPWRQL